MRAIPVNLDSFDLFTINVASDVFPALDYQTTLSPAAHLFGKDAAIQASANNQIVVFCHAHSPNVLSSGPLFCRGLHCVEYPSCVRSHTSGLFCLFV